MLEEGLNVERESVRRAATYGLVAAGTPATPVFLRATQSAAKWVRKAGAFGLGAAAETRTDALEALAARLLEDPSVYVRSVAADAIGCFARRTDDRGLHARCFEVLATSLEREENRLAMNVAQGRSIKFVRPTDESDVCEGIGIDYGEDRFERVRSAVRENALWSTVILSTRSLAPTSFVALLQEIVAHDRNVFVVGLAMDALCRLARNGQPGIDVKEVLASAPLRDWESLARAGVTRETLAAFL